MKPEQVKAIEIAEKVRFIWGKFKGTHIQFVPSKLLKWSFENIEHKESFTDACKLVWQYREDTGTHYKE